MKKFLNRADVGTKIDSYYLSDHNVHKMVVNEGVFCHGGLAMIFSTVGRLIEFEDRIFFLEVR